MNIRINGTELKSILDKAIANIDPKSKTVEHLTRIYVSVDNGKLTLTTFNMVEERMQLDTYTENFFVVNMEKYQPFSIDLETAKLISKFKNEVIINLNDDSTITIKHGRKTITLNCMYITNETEITKVSVDSEKEKRVLEMNESEFIKTLSDLEIFANKDNVNRFMKVFNINTMKHRITTLDGHRIGIRNLKEEYIVDRDLEINMTIHCLKALKKLANKKDITRNINVSFDGKYIAINGKDYTYTINATDGKFFDVESFLTSDYTNTLKVKDRDQWLEVFKYDDDLRKQGGDEHKPIIFYHNDNELYCYFENNKCRTLDIMETKDKFIEDQFTIGFNPKYMQDAFNVLNDGIEIGFNNSKSPATIKDKDYTLVVLPVNYGNNNGKLHDKIRSEIEKSKQAA